jgi:hypothetical protein
MGGKGESEVAAMGLASAGSSLRFDEKFNSNVIVLLSESQR